MRNSNPITYREVSADKHAPLPLNHSPTHQHSSPPNENELLELSTLSSPQQSISPTPPASPSIPLPDTLTLPICTIHHDGTNQTHLSLSARTDILLSPQINNIAAPLINSNHMTQEDGDIPTTTQRIIHMDSLHLNTPYDQLQSRPF
jgi:hypothetical protein